jgi:hypothetical protein
MDSTRSESNAERNLLAQAACPSGEPTDKPFTTFERVCNTRERASDQYTEANLAPFYTHLEEVHDWLRREIS